jgi:hypothetical protein
MRRKEHNSVQHKRALATVSRRQGQRAAPVLPASWPHASAFARVFVEEEWCRPGFPYALRYKEHDSDDHNVVTGRADMVAACGMCRARHALDREERLCGAGFAALRIMKLSSVLLSSIAMTGPAQ